MMMQMVSMKQPNIHSNRKNTAKIAYGLVVRLSRASVKSWGTFCVAMSQPKGVAEAMMNKMIAEVTTLSEVAFKKSFNVISR